MPGRKSWRMMGVIRNQQAFWRIHWIFSDVAADSFREMVVQRESASTEATQENESKLNACSKPFCR